LEDFNGNYEGFLEKLHENHLNLLIDPNYSTYFEILIIFILDRTMGAYMLTIFRFPRADYKRKELRNA